MAFGLLAAFAAAQVQAPGTSALDDERARRIDEIAFFTTGFDDGGAKLTCAPADSADLQDQCRNRQG